jgi:hypothetical protein
VDSVAPTLTSYLSIAGLGLDFFGAAFLAFDALIGAKARYQASMRRRRLAVARETHERHNRRLREVSQWPAAREDESPSAKAHRLETEMQALTEAVRAAIAELKHREKHEERVHLHALVGMLLLMAGFACQGVSALLE